MIGMTESLRGALMLARFDKRGLGAFDGSTANARASFRVVWPLLGFYLIMAVILFSLMGGAGTETSVETTIDEAGNAASEGEPLSDMMALQVAGLLFLSQVIAWLGLLVMMHAMLVKGGMGHRVHTAMAAYNWTLFWRKALEVMPLLMIAIGVGAGGGAQFLQFCVMIYSMVFLFFTMKTALEGRGFDAAIIVFLEVMLALTVPLMAFQSDPAAFQAVLQVGQASQ